MTTSEQMKRLEALEAAADAKRFEEHLEAHRPELMKMAKEDGISFDALVMGIRESYERIAEVGEEQWFAETAAELGGTVEELKSGELYARRDREIAEWEEERRRRRADVITWRGGTPPIPYRNGEIVRDANGEPLRFR